MSEARFIHLLNRMEHAAPDEQNYRAYREAVLRYVRGLEAIRDQLLALQIGAKSAMHASSPAPDGREREP